MNAAIQQMKQSLREAFSSVKNMYVNPAIGACEVFISVDDYQGEINKTNYQNGVLLKMVDYCDTFPFKYVFNYKFAK